MDLTSLIRRVAQLTARASYTSSAATVLLAGMPSIGHAQAEVQANSMDLSALGVWVGIGCAVFTALVSSGTTVLFKWLEYRATLKAKGLEKNLKDQTQNE
jgi:MFS-type transporter involved in bile tolerance (Atg22 family)